MSRRKLGDLPHPLALPELLGSAGNSKPPGASHELKGVKGQWRKRQQDPQPLLSFSVWGVGLGRGGVGGFSRRRVGISSFPGFQLWALLSFSYCPGAAADSL